VSSVSVNRAVADKNYLKKGDITLALKQYDMRAFNSGDDVADNNGACDSNRRV
jgi:hypothetical protein